MLNGINDMAKNTEHARMREDAEKLADIFTVLQRCFLSNLSRELSRGHVSFPQYFLLGYLGQQKSLSMSEIAAIMSHTTAAATGLVDRLVKLGYVRRRPARDDRRKILVQVTKKARASSREFTKIWWAISSSLWDNSRQASREPG